MNTENKFNWPRRQTLCLQQLDLCRRIPTSSLVDGIPIENYWQQQLDIAHKHAATFNEMLDELAAYNDVMPLPDAHERIRKFYSQPRYDEFIEWMDSGSIETSNAN